MSYADIMAKVRQSVRVLPVEIHATNAQKKAIAAL